MQVNDIKAFVPCENYEVSKLFYQEIGFKLENASDDLTLLLNGDCRLFLQRFYNSDLADNFMLQVCVADINAAYELCSQSVYKRKISAIEKEHWGTVFYLWGPSGELLHITQLCN